MSIVCTLPCSQSVILSFSNFSYIPTLFCLTTLACLTHYPVSSRLSAVTMLTSPPTLALYHYLCVVLCYRGQRDSKSCSFHWTSCLTYLKFSIMRMHIAHGNKCAMPWLETMFSGSCEHFLLLTNMHYDKRWIGHTYYTVSCYVGNCG